MTGILIYSEKDNLALELLTAARIIASGSDAEIKAVTVNNDQQAKVLADAGAKVFKINASDLIVADTVALAQALGQAAEELKTDIIILASNRRGKELAGRLAQGIGAGCITDVTALRVNNGHVECQRNALGGATIATQYIDGEKQVLAVAPKTFTVGTGSGGCICELQVKTKPSGIKVLEVKNKDENNVNIDEAEVLIAVGQGLKSKEDLNMVSELAELLGGEVACSKPLATDKKWLEDDRVIGLSGKICRPELAVLFGISGQVQFTVGIRDAKIIAAVNTDENASINQMADYILNDDLHNVIPDLIRLLK